VNASENAFSEKPVEVLASALDRRSSAQADSTPFTSDHERCQQYFLRLYSDSETSQLEVNAGHTMVNLSGTVAAVNEMEAFGTSNRPIEQTMNVSS
jgi:hypothetical protein